MSDSEYAAPLGSPRRIQRRRTKGWRMPENTVSVCRSGKWGNPFHVVKFGREWFVHDSLSDQHSRPFRTKQEAATEAVGLFRYVLERKHREHLAEFLAPLKGKNLACFCGLSEPCHADVLLDMANAGDQTASEAR